MKTQKHFLLIFLTFFYTTLFADPMFDFVRELEEQETLKVWVKDNAHSNLTTDKINLILRQVYFESESKDINPHLLLAIIKTESGFRDKVRSVEGATGLMQVIPKYHKDKIKNRDPTNTKVSIEVGSQILYDCLNKFNQNISRALNCYSGGSGTKYATRVVTNQKKITLFIKNNLFNKQLLAQN